MKSAFVKNKDLADLDCSFRVRILGGNHARVYVWRSKRGMKRNTNFAVNDHVGAFVTIPDPDGALVCELHFVQKWVGGGVVAHELMHLMLWWMTDPATGQYDNDLDPEQLCLLAGNITRRFWKKWYKRYARTDAQEDKHK